jgi:hypothetical protein
MRTRKFIWLFLIDNIRIILDGLLLASVSGPGAKAQVLKAPADWAPDGLPACCPAPVWMDVPQVGPQAALQAAWVASLVGSAALLVAWVASLALKVSLPVASVASQVAMASLPAWMDGAPVARQHPW